MPTKTKYIIPQLSVFFPCYNEEKNIQNTVNKAIPILNKITPKWEIIIVNDGSTDKTLEKARTLVKKYGRGLKIINHPKNRGYGAAFKSGLYNSKYDWIAFTDADGQFDFSEITKLIKKQKQTKADLVIGYYKGRKVPFYRIWGSKLWELVVFLLFGLKVTDIDCGFKLIKKKVVNTIPKLEAERGPFINSEFLIKTKKQGFKIVEIGVSHFERQFGTATGAQLKVIFSGFKDLITLWKKLNLA